ncbi:unnamed protein product [Kuraishia capsulata CBS 1993]|uniref:ATPase synthesis protein 25 n=1 Tax=Kuraishia capsulata CBS 1993 TaxID=1382522 RepID=W6MM37_9ASCO|nr:uncharacterized protein KUCA_T00003226001 [Kuraishia capsulata CBS 1993]CDK27248.1 unnamed protein product [Kuraishia capsulata CBS 1993]
MWRFTLKRNLRCIRSARSISQTPYGISLRETTGVTRPICRSLSTNNDISIDAKPTDQEATDSRPWYLRSEEPESAIISGTEMPEIPQDAPARLVQIVEYIAKQLSMENLLIFDVRSDHRDGYQGSQFVGDFMIIGSGKSAKHLHKATEELNNYVKKDLDTIPSYEGLLKSSDLFTARKRYKRKLKKSPAYALNDYGATANSWVMIDTNVDGIYVHFLTQERREELNLEELWASPEEKHLYQPRANIVSDSDDIFSGIRYFHTSTARYQRSDLDILAESAEKGDYKLAMEFNSKFNTFERQPESTDQMFMILRAHVKGVSSAETAEEVAALEDSFQQAFPVSSPSRGHWLCRVDFYLELLRKFPQVGYAKLFWDNFAAMQASGEMLTGADLSEFFKALTECPSDENRTANVSETLVSASGLLLSTYPHIQQEVPGSGEAVSFERIFPKLLPYIFGLGSSMESKDFITPNDVPVSSNTTQVPAAPFITVLPALLKQSRYQWISNDQTTERNLLLYLSVLANSSQWKLFWDFLDSLSKEADVLSKEFPWLFVLNLVAAKGNASACHFFLTKKWPYLSTNVIDESLPSVQESLEIIRRRVSESEQI